MIGGGHHLKKIYIRAPNFGKIISQLQSKIQAHMLQIIWAHMLQNISAHMQNWKTEHPPVPAFPWF